MRRRVISRVVLALCVFVFAACGSGAGQAGKTTTQNKPLPSAGTVTAMIPGMGGSDESGFEIVGDDAAIWVLNDSTGDLMRIDPTTNKLVATIAVGRGPGGVALGQGAVWTVSPALGAVSKIDPQSNSVVATVTIGQPFDSPKSIAVSPGAVWVGDFADNSLIRIDPQSHQMVATIPNQFGIFGVSYDSGSVWACNHHSYNQGLVRLDPQSNQVLAQFNPNQVMTKTNPPSNLGACFAVRAVAQAVWTTTFTNDDPSSFLLERIDPATNTVKATIAAPGMLPHDLAADAHGVWLLNPNVGLYRVDPTKNRLAGVLVNTDLNEGLGVGAGSVWVVRSDGTLLRITPAA
jgi:YVTN family beta-propeller protein